MCVVFSTDDEAVSLANDTDYGLAAGIWSVDEEFANKIAAKIDAGPSILITTVQSVHARLLGVKKSGYGRELGLMQSGISCKKKRFG